MIVITACSPMTKESYMEKYGSFISEISENHKIYSEKDWRKQTGKYDKFSDEWYEKFKDDLTLKDEIAIKTNQTKWYYYRHLNTATSSIKQLFESLDVNEIKKQVQYYIDNNMPNDLQKFYKDAQKAGKDAEEALTEILEELNVKIDEL
jgi:hypothetical protein